MWRRLVAALLVATMVTMPVAVSADRRDDERTELVRRQQALLVELDELAATDQELVQALDTLDAWVFLQTGEVEQAMVQLAEATLAAERAAAEEVAKQAEVEELEGLMAMMAVSAYVQPPATDHFETFLRSSAPNDAVRLNVYLDVQARRDTDLVQQLRRARAQLTTIREFATSTEINARAASDVAAEKLTELEDSRERHAEIRAAVRYRQQMAGYESELVMLDIGRSNTQLAAEASSRRGGGIPVVSVRGIRVHRSIAGQIELLLAAAEADGIRLGGGGYRTNREQIELRRRHCGDDPYSIYEKPATECAPPTARPGNSMHELGLAIDFTHNGSAISSQRSPAFRWLADNAAIYGLYNLASEPWHWSINGS